MGVESVLVRVNESAEGWWCNSLGQLYLETVPGGGDSLDLNIALFMIAKKTNE